MNSVVLLPPKKQGNVCIQAKWPIRQELIPVSDEEYFLLTPGWGASPSQGYPQYDARQYLYTWVERGPLRERRSAQEQNAMSPTRARTQIARSGDERTNHEATAPPMTFKRIFQ